MKKLIIVFLLVFGFVSMGFAQSWKYEKGFAGPAVYSTQAQVFTTNIVLYGFDIRTDGKNSVEIQFYDTSGWTAWAPSGKPNYAQTTGTKIGPRYFITSSATDRTQVHAFPTAVQTTSGGVYMDINTDSTQFEIGLYYQLSNAY